MQLRERGACLGEQDVEFFVGCFGAVIDLLQISDQLRGDPPPGLPGRVAGSDFY